MMGSIVCEGIKCCVLFDGMLFCIFVIGFWFFCSSDSNFCLRVWFD